MSVLGLIYASIGLLVLLRSSLVHLGVSLLILFFWVSLFLLLVVKVEFLAISFLIIYIGAIAVLLVFGLMVLGVSSKSAQRQISWFSALVAINLAFLFAKFSEIFNAIQTTRMGLRAFLAQDLPYSGLAITWAQDVSALGVTLYNSHLGFFWTCGLLLFVAICSIIAMITPTRDGWRRPSIQ